VYAEFLQWEHKDNLSSKHLICVYQLVNILRILFSTSLICVLSVLSEKSGNPLSYDENGSFTCDIIPQGVKATCLFKGDLELNYVYKATLCLLIITTVSSTLAIISLSWRAKENSAKLTEMMPRSNVFEEAEKAIENEFNAQKERRIEIQKNSQSLENDCDDNVNDVTKKKEVSPNTAIVDAEQFGF